MANRFCNSVAKNLLRFSITNLQTRCLIPPRIGQNITSFLQKEFHTSRCLEGVTEVKMPSLSPTMTEGTIVKWNKNEGDPIAAGDVLCEIQTDKAVVALEVDDDGVLAKIVLPENSADVKVGQLIALLVGEGEDWKNVEVPAGAVSEAPASASAPKADKPAAADKPSSPPPQGSTGQRGSTGPMGPAVKTLLAQYGLRSSDIESSGPRGLLLKGDVLRHVSAKNLKPVKQESAPPPAPKAGKAAPPRKTGVPAAPTDIEITSMRRTIAKRLLQSKSTVPHAYGVSDCRLDRVMSLRKELQAVGIKLSVNDFIIKVTGNALSKCPSINVVWEGSSLVQKGSVDISVAVATDKGLITPIVTNVAGRDVIQISEEVKILAEKARNGKLQPHEFMGGSFSISNLGMFGIHNFSAIINPPQCAILAVGGGHMTLDKRGNPISTVKFTLSYDGSAISEEDAAKFLANLKNEVENASEISMGIYNIQSRLEMIELSAAAK